MKVRQKRCNLLFREAAAEAGHHSLPSKNILPYGGVGGRCAAGQGLAVKNAVQVGRNLLERQVVVFVAMCASNLVKMLAFRLLRGE